MEIHIIDGTYELFRYYHAVPSKQTRDGQEVAATVGVTRSLLGLLAGGASHVAVATDHVIESFRNQLWPGYKSGAGLPEELTSQFALLEQVLAAAGLTVWPMVEHEADDGLATGAALAAADARVERVLIATPDKDLAQCVDGERVVLLDRRKDRILDEAAVIEKYGVTPASIPDWLALVGDSADGFPGLPGWGARSAAAVLRRYQRIEAIPPLAKDWEVAVRGRVRLASTLDEGRDLALLFRRIATVVRDAPIGTESVDELRWRGPTAELAAIAERLEVPELSALAEIG